MEKIFHYKLPNGATLVAEKMDYVSSAALSILVPVGSATDPGGQEGAANVLAEMVQRGAGPWNSRELSEQFEALGIHRSHAAGIEVTVFSGALLGENLAKALPLFAALVLNPHLPEEELDNVRQLSLQELKSLEDEPSSKVMVELAQRFYPYPFGRCQLGTEDGLNSLTIDSLKDYFKRQMVPANAIIGVAGKFDWNEVKDAVEQSFGAWQGDGKLLEPGAFSRKSAAYHIEKDTNQIQIALAYPSVSFEHTDYYAAKVAVGVLSGGMAGRLFIEVREKRGLVYRVSASHSAARGRAAIFCYAGTTPDHSEETLSIMMRELRNLKNGVTDEELKRAKADLKSKIIMQGEISSVRASSIVNDWWHIGRVRTLNEIKAAIDAVGDADIRRHLGEYPIEPVTLTVLGPKKLELPQ